MAFSKTLAEMEQNVPDSDARKRLNALFDEDSFKELDKFMSADGELSSVVAGYGTIMGAGAYTGRERKGRRGKQERGNENQKGV